MVKETYQTWRAGVELDLEVGNQKCLGKEPTEYEEIRFITQETDVVSDSPGSPRAPDGGWSWMVLLGSFIILVSKFYP